MTIEQARKKTPREVIKIHDGRHVGAEKRAARQAATLHDLASEYVERWAKKKKKSWREDKRFLNKDVMPK